MEYIYIALIGLSAGTVKGYSGFGSSLVAIPLLRILYGEITTEHIAILVAFSLVLNTLLLVENKGFHPESLKRVWLIPLFGVIFTFVGIQVLFSVSGDVLGYIAGSFIILAILNKVFGFRVKLHDTPFTRIVVGALSGIGNGIASIDGPPVVIYLTSINAPKVQFKNVLAAHFLVMGVVAVGIHLFSGSYTIDGLMLLGMMLICTAVGLFIGMFLSRRSNEKVFQQVILVIMFGLAISLFL